MGVAAGVLCATMALSGCGGLIDWIVSPVTPDHPEPTVIGNRDWSQLEVGECVSDDVSLATIPGRATRVQCAGGKAMAELVATSSPDATSSTRPESQTKASIDTWCQTAFEQYLGIKANKSGYKIYWIDAEGQLDNVQCFAASDQPLAGSVQNTKK